MRKMKMYKCIGFIIALVLSFTAFSPSVVYASMDSGEGMIAALVTGIGTAINLLLSVVLGRQVTIDDFVFNHYPDTKIDFFLDGKPGVSGVGRENGKTSVLIWGNKGDGKGGLYETINQWYKFFNSLALIVYMIMLIYMGIRVMLSSTGQNMAQYKTQFMYWVIGIAILFFYPYVMKYIIVLNNAFVKTIEDSKGVILDGIDIPEASTLKSTSGANSLEEIDMDSNPFDENGTDYMSQIAKDAWNSSSLALALTFLILTWQLLTIALHYYKRLMMIGFLIVIFPIVMSFYVLDKVGDGKSQSFEKWNKDFILNVFIQSFHAIVYIFVIGTVYSAKGSNGSYDYILVIIGATFLFTGEEIVKKIFSQDSPGKTVSSLSETAATAMKTAVAAKAITATVTAPAMKTAKIGSNVVRAARDMKNSGKKYDVAEKLGLFSAAAEPDAGLRLDGAKNEMDRINNSKDLSEADKTAQRAEVKRVANALAAINNPNTRSAQELADAYNTLNAAKDTDIGKAVINGSTSKVNDAQMSAMQNMQRQAAQMASEGADAITIDRTLKLKLAYTLPEMTDDERDKYRRMLLADMALRGGGRYQSPKQSAHDDIEEMMEELNNVGDSFKFVEGNKSSKGKKGTAKEFSNENYKALDGEAKRFAESFCEDGVEPTDEELRLAKDILVINKRKMGNFDGKQYMRSLNHILEAEESDSEVVSKMIGTIDTNPEILRMVVAQKMKGHLGRGDLEATKIREEMGGEESRNGYYDDEVSPEELLAAMSIEDETERNNAIQEMEDRIAAARIKVNAHEGELIRDVAADILAIESEEVGYNVMTAGELDTTTEYFEGKTREQIAEERRTAKMNIVRSLIGIDTKTVDKGYSEEYIKNQQALRDHYYGDNPSK